jgi:hypothetical protein
VINCNISTNLYTHSCMHNKIYLLIIFVVVLAIGFYLNMNSGEKITSKESGNPTQASQNMSFFITSKNPGNGGNLGGLSGADAYCGQLAASAGVSGKTWKAYLSTTGTSSVNAKDRIGNGPWFNYKGELIANNLTELHGENNLNKNTALTEKGEIVSGRGDEVNVHDILTGSTADGIVVATSTDTTCNNWTSDSTGSAVVGHHDRIGINETAPMKYWNSSHGSRGCSLENLKTTGGGGLFYCFEAK